ncbi:hypothetical protein E1301_Tti020634 [Triplophysa tibetana]|uniref:Uncharacterized protein n=1 Tax=Triplophysa tibetana TaxID=1572043 RepID=A0A5A9PK86_9TELE|nr:hypothetical protein E1301_Tti020634 [Triplophysa tibetana]
MDFIKKKNFHLRMKSWHSNKNSSIINETIVHTSVNVHYKISEKVEDLSDIDDPVEDVDYHPPQQESISSEEESSGHEDPFHCRVVDTVELPLYALPDVGLSGLRPMVQTMTLKPQHKDRAFKNNTRKDEECAGGLLD